MILTKICQFKLKYAGGSKDYSKIVNMYPTNRLLSESEVTKIYKAQTNSDQKLSSTPYSNFEQLSFLILASLNSQ